MSKNEIVWRIYNITDKGQRGAILIGTVNAHSKLEAEEKAVANHFRARYNTEYQGSYFAHV